jgi:hypothetical protein
MHPDNDSPGELAPIADRMYPDLAKPSTTPEPTSIIARATAGLPPLKEAPKPAAKPGTPTIPSLAERMYREDGPIPDNYAPTTQAAFDPIERDLRRAGEADNLKALAAGRELVHATLKELEVGSTAAKEITRGFGTYRAKPVRDEHMDGHNANCERQLRALWPKPGQYEQNLQHAFAAVREAGKRIPWLRDELDLGAGSDPAVIAAFAKVGKRLAAKAKK